MITDDLQNPTKKTCIKCGNLIAVSSKFCNGCGVIQTNEISTESKWSLIKQAGFFYAVTILLCVLVNFVDAFQTFGWYIFFVGALAIVTVSFFVFNWAENKSVLTWHSFSLQKLCAYCGLAIIASVLVHFSVGWLNVTIYAKQEEYYTALRGNLFGEFILIFFTAVMPALFEELGFRGYLLQTLLKVADVQQAVYISSFLFAIIHMSFISLFWLIPFALFVGFVRTKEGTLWYGVFIHFCFNLTACMFLLSGG